MDMKAKVNLTNIISYLQGNIRYKLFYSNFAFLIPVHIREQIQYRINSMDVQCYAQGYCKMCGCQTTALQMANKACDKPCYPSLVSKKRWNRLKKGVLHIENNIPWRVNTDRMHFYNAKEKVNEELGAGKY